MLSATIVHSSIHTNVSRSYVCVLVRIRLILCVRFSRFSLHLQFVCFCVGADQAVYYLNDIKKTISRTTDLISTCQIITEGYRDNFYDI